MPAILIFADIIDVSHVSLYQIRIVGPTGERVERLQKDECVIGRSAQADLIVANVEVSRKHITLKFDGTQLWITDEGSKNGTFIDGIKIPPNVARPWRVGQFVKMGLAPERLTLEMVNEISVTSSIDAKTKADGPPPMESVQRSITHNVVPSTNPEIRMDKSKPDIPVKDRASELMADFEKKMQEVMARTEASQSKSEITRPPIKIVEPQSAPIERVKSESQIKDLGEEVRNRLSERKHLARESADLKLAIQNSRAELERLKVAQVQIAPILAQESKIVEEQIQKAKTDFENQLAQFKAQAMKEAKDLVEKAKKQAEMLIQEAEIKAKNIREKLQTQMADQRKSSELELAEQKIKQVAELKETQDKLEAKWQAKKEELSAAFLRDVRTRCENQIFATQMESGIKLRLLTSIEESLHQHFLGASDNLGFDQEEVTADRQPLAAVSGQTEPLSKADLGADDQDEPLKLTRFRVSSRGLWSVMAALILGAISILFYNQSPVPLRPNVTQELTQTSVASQAPPTSASQPATAQQPAIVPPPANAVSRVTAVAPQPQPPPPKGAHIDLWVNVLKTNSLPRWQAESAAFMIESLKMDRRKINRYQTLESQYATEIVTLQSRMPASETDWLESRSRFERNAIALFGAAQWNKFLAYREYFRLRNP